MRLHSELSLNYAAIPLVLDLLVRVDSLERRLVEITQVEGTASR
jgi:chaperone modulatory protein CbpM